jgi:hypothetical protein
MKRTIVLRAFSDEELKRTAQRYMLERFGWVSDPTHAAYVSRYAEALEAMMFLREREEREFAVRLELSREGRERRKQLGGAGNRSAVVALPGARPGDGISENSFPEEARP